jgi:hypothetical protein
MKVEVIVAIISGIAAIAGALIASIQAVRMSRLKAETDAKLEQLKAETSIAVETMKDVRERRHKAFEIAAQESAPLEAALAQAWEDIQLIKEIISKLVSPDRYDLDIALDHLTPPCSRLMDGYAKWGASIPEHARKAWHAAKGDISAFRQILVTESNTSNSQLPSATIEILKETRTFLTDHQMVIVASRQSIRDLNIKHLLEVI